MQFSALAQASGPFFIVASQKVACSLNLAMASAAPRVFRLTTIEKYRRFSTICISSSTGTGHRLLRNWTWHSTSMSFPGRVHLCGATLYLVDPGHSPPLSGVADCVYTLRPPARLVPAFLNRVHKNRCESDARLDWPCTARMVQTHPDTVHGLLPDRAREVHAEAAWCL